MSFEAVSARGAEELRAARAAGLGLVMAIGLFSAAVNLLMLTGPVFMLQVYDRVLASRSVETLAALFLLVAFLYLLMGVLDWSRNRVMTRVAARFQQRIEGRVFAAALREGAVRQEAEAATGGLRDLDAVGRFLASPVLMALFDLPWAPLFLAVIFVFHPLLGAVALGGGVILVAAMVATRRLTRAPLQNAALSAAQAPRMALYAR